jgi:hypothetical protein
VTSPPPASIIQQTSKVNTRRRGNLAALPAGATVSVTEDGTVAPVIEPVAPAPVKSTDDEIKRLMDPSFA